VLAILRPEPAAAQARFTVVNSVAEAYRRAVR